MRPIWLNVEEEKIIIKPHVFCIQLWVLHSLTPCLYHIGTSLISKSLSRPVSVAAPAKRFGCGTTTSESTCTTLEWTRARCDSGWQWRRRGYSSRQDYTGNRPGRIQSMAELQYLLNWALPKLNSVAVSCYSSLLNKELKRELCKRKPKYF